MSETKPTQEQQDAEDVERAVELIYRGDLGTAEALLKAVAANTPAGYSFTTEGPEGELRMRFWDQEDFIYYVALNQEKGKIKQSIAWAPNAYGRAHYYLGFVAAKKGRAQEALRHLDAGLLLEPDQPFFYLEKGKILGSMRQLEAALDAYSAVLDRGEDIPPAPRAAALRGKGFLLIEVDMLDLAEQYLLGSLMLDPESTVAHNELAYIASLRRGGQRKHVETVQSGGKSTPIACSLCSQSMEKGAVLRMNDRLVYVCENCNQAMQERTAKKRWQF